MGTRSAASATELEAARLDTGMGAATPDAELPLGNFREQPLGGIMEWVKHGGNKTFQVRVALRTEAKVFILAAAGYAACKTASPIMRGWRRILVEMHARAGMMDLVMRRAQDYPSAKPVQGNPELRVLQMAPERHVEGIDNAADGGAGHRKGIPAKYWIRPIVLTPDDRLDIDVEDGIDRMHSPVGKRRQHGGRMVNLMEFPEERDLMR